MVTWPVIAELSHANPKPYPNLGIRVWASGTLNPKHPESAEQNLVQGIENNKIDKYLCYTLNIPKS